VSSDFEGAVVMHAVLLVDILSAVASIAVAAFTGWLAWSTRNLSRETATLSRDTVAATLAGERHHQDQMRPLLILEAALIVRVLGSTEKNPNIEFELDGAICNFGGGPATAIQLHVEPFGNKAQEKQLGVMGPNSRRELRGVKWPSWTGDFHEDGSSWPFKAVLGYSTVGFTQNVGTTTQASSSGKSEDLAIISVRPTEFNDQHEATP
jgi:hypothetical protein